jgi:drug/metabolite transporter (DMT)-like permease
MQMNYSIIFAFGAMVFWAIGDFLIQRMTRKMGNLSALVWINFIGSLVLLPFAIKDFHLLNSLESFLPLVILAVIDFVFGLILLKAYEQGKLSVVEIIMILELPLTVVLGVVFFKERLSTLQIFLILTIIVGAILISRRVRNLLTRLWEFITKRKRAWEKGAILALIAAVLSALYNFFVALNTKNLSPTLAIWFPWTISLFFLIVYLGFRRNWKNFFALSRQNMKLIFWGSVIDVTAWVFFAMALSGRKLSITTAITESYPALAIFLAMQFNKEKISFRQIIGAILALTASAVIGLIS